MKTIPLDWQIVHRPDGSVEIGVERSASRRRVASAVIAAGICCFAWHLVVGAVQDSVGARLEGVSTAGCLVALALASCSIFCSQTWIVARDSLAIENAFLGLRRVRRYRNGYFEFVAREHESGHFWILQVSSPDGRQELFRPHLISELDGVAEFLSQHTGWPVKEYQGP